MWRFRDLPFFWYPTTSTVAVIILHQLCWTLSNFGQTQIKYELSSRLIRFLLESRLLTLQNFENRAYSMPNPVYCKLTVKLRFDAELSFCTDLWTTRYVLWDVVWSCRGKSSVKLLPYRIRAQLVFSWFLSEFRTQKPHSTPSDAYPTVHWPLCRCLDV